MAGGVTALANLQCKVDSNNNLVVALDPTSSVVISIAGTANEIAASASTGAVTLSFPSGHTGTGAVVLAGSPTFSAGAIFAGPLSGITTFAQSGVTVSGSATTSFHTIAGTWNTSGVNVGAVQINITDTASGANSLSFAIYGGASASTSLFKVDKGGVVNAASDVISGRHLVSTNNVSAGAGSSIYWTARSVMASPSDGVFAFSNQASATGVRMSVGTDGTAAFLSFAGTDGAILKANKVNATGNFQQNGTDGVTAGPFTVITGITVKGGIITAITGS